MYNQLAVEVKNAVFQYETGVNILDNMSVNIPEGKIFALLGPNGAGKTTLISIIIGRLQLKSGSVKVLGIEPGTKYHEYPGKSVGYMPQDLALFEELTIEEILKFYANIVQLNELESTQSIENLSKVLNLPEKSRFINTLSGGQKRLVSIAITMIHRPKLIILDEPTVGVDSLLRHKFWQFLENMCQQNNQTVLITTHYIEEAKSAANIAFMNYGTVLKQSNPQKLLQQYRCQTLEAVFLILCENENNKNNVNELKIPAKFKKKLLKTKMETVLRLDYNISFSRIKAMLWKYYVSIIRRHSFIFLFLALPLMILTSVKLGISQYPKYMPVVVFNSDNGNKYSRIFIDSIDKEDFNLKFTDNNETAIESVVNGTNYMSIFFGQNFSESFDNRVRNVFELTDEELKESQINIHIDMSNAAIGIALFKYLFQAFNRFLNTIGTKFEYNERYFNFVSVEQPIYGQFEFNLKNIAGPGIILAISNGLPLVLTAYRMAFDRKNLGRIFVTGVKPLELIIALLVVSTILFSFQLLFTLLFAFFVNEFTQIGSCFDVYLLLILTGIQGMSIGILIALLAKEEGPILMLTLSILFPLWISSGILWPIETTPQIFRYLMYISPLTLPVQALKSIMLRGWTFTHSTVSIGLIINIVYIIVVNIINWILLTNIRI